MAINYDTALFYTFSDKPTGFMRIGKRIAAEYDHVYVIKGGGVVDRSKLKSSGYYTATQLERLIEHVDKYNADRLNEINEVWHIIQGEINGY